MSPRFLRRDQLFYRWNKGLFAALATAGAMLVGTQPAVFAAGEKQLASTGAAEAGSATAATPDEHWKMLDDKCGKCHNSQDWAGGLAFDILDRDPAGIAADAEAWENTIRKLRGRLMPPPGEPQPDQRTIDAFVAWMEGELDRAAAAHPDPGYVGLHRLNRTEYAREIERILGLQVDVKNLLPQDVSSDGFDNIATTLRISPSFVDQYITAARNVARQAIGSVTQKPSSREFRVDGSNQDFHVDGLPLGTRGGFVIDHYFPADGEYEFSIRDFFFMGAGYVTKVDSRHTVIMTIDGVRVFQQDAGGPEDLNDVDLRQAAAADEMQARFNRIRVKVKAGQHKVGVAFVQRSFAQSDSPLQPIAMLPEMERAPLIPGIDISGPFNVTGLSETESRRRVFICRPANEAEELPCARRIFTNLATEAFRRPATEEDLKAPLQFYENGRKAGHDFESGIESGLTAILSSTKFLFRSEPAVLNAKPGESVKLNDLELASRLSFFLWSSGPDDELLKLATAGRLSDPKVLNEQVHRMLADPRAESLVTNFAFQWLNVGRIDNIQPDPVLYPDFGPDLREAFREEIRLFLGSVLLPNRSVLDLIRSDTTYLNERLAVHYGIPNVRGAQFRPVQLKDANRWGLFGKGAVLMGTSYGNRTSPVLRGSWILENIAGTPPSSPPPGVEQFQENEPGKKAATVRERLEQHRANPSCNGCHGVIDPLGFALENYDVVGAWRDIDRDAGDVIDARGRLASGIEVNGPAELSKSVLARPEQFVQALTEKLMTFALGRAVRHQDMPTVRAIVREAAKDDYRFESILRGIASSPAFQMRQVPTAMPDSKQAMVTQD
jgi:mono/diheme cytochrome c family protein